MSDTHTTQSKHDGNGNHTKHSRARLWFFTWCNYELNYVSTLTHAFHDAELYVFQPEKGEGGTPHIQGVVEFKNPRTFESLCKKVPSAHFEKTRNREAAIKYCSKPDTRDGETISYGIKAKKVEIAFLKDWQRDVMDLIKSTNDDRSIHWVYDKDGGQGKTKLCRHLINEYGDTAAYICGKSADMKYAIAKKVESGYNPRLILLDFTRSLENYISYEGIESVKNGLFFSTKYESGTVMIDPPVVICFANFLPDQTKLSIDRWNIINISPVKELESE